MMQDLTLYLPGILAAYAILIVAAFSPGPSIALLIGIATAEGRKPAMTATLGIAVGSLTLNILTLVGLGLLLAQAAWAVTLLRYLGAAYLAWLAIGAFRRAIHPPELTPTQTQNRSALRLFMTGYLLMISNPKAVAFWLVIATVGAVETAPAAIILFYVAGAFVISALCHGAWAVTMSASPVRAFYGYARRWIEAGIGTFLTYSAFKLATAER